MKIICSRENLLNGIQITQHCVSTKASHPILTGILLTAHENTLTFQATDLDLAIQCSFPIEVIEEGSIVVQARHFLDLVRRLPDRNICLEFNYQTRLLTLTYGSAKFDINTFDTEEFPVFPSKPKEYSLKISQIIFKKAIRQVTIAASNNPVRPIFTGVLMEIEPEYFQFVATNTHRLAKKKIEDSRIKIEEPKHIIVPARAFNELNRLLRDDETPLNIALTSNHIVFSTDEFIFYSKPIQGHYPDYQKVIPKKILSKVIVTIKELLSCIERASLLISTKEGNSIVHFFIKKNCLIIESMAANLGSMYEEISVVTEGEEINISFNTRYLLDVLKILESDEIIMEFTGQFSPCIIYPASEENYLYLVLPVRN